MEFRQSIKGRRPNRRTVVAVVSLASAGLLCAATQVRAADSGALTLTVGVALPVRSITVSSSGSTTYPNCTRGGVSTGASLSAPNGVCTTSGGQITVTVGEVSSVVDVATSNIVATGATPWTPVAGTPGPDQFKLEILNPFGSQPAVNVTGTPVCDTSTFTTTPTSACVTIPANSSGNSNLRLTGPSVVTSNVTTPWTHTITWRALPPLGGA